MNLINNPFPTLKISLLFYFLVGCSSSYAVTNQELMDRLDDIEFENQMREMNREMDELLRQQRKQAERNNLNNSPSSSSTYISSGSYIKRTAKVIAQNSERIIAIDRDSIKRVKTDVILYTSAIEFDKPQYEGNKVYYGTTMTSLMNCANRQHAIMGYISYNKNLKIVSSENFPLLFIPGKGPIFNAEYDFLCSSK